MFYSQFLLSRKGPLGVIWIAAHLEGKLRKKHITDTDIAESVGKYLTLFIHLGNNPSLLRSPFSMVIVSEFILVITDVYSVPFFLKYVYVQI